MADTVGGGFPSSGIQKGGLHFDIDDSTLWEFLGGPATSISSWKLISGVFTNNPDTAEWGLAQRGATWWNSSEGKLKVWNGSSVQDITPNSSVYDYRSQTILQDDFLSGTTTSGSVGSIGWTTSGTVSLVASENSNLGIYNISTGGGAGTQGRIVLPVNPSINPAVDIDLKWLCRLTTNDANTTVRIGAQNNVALDPPANGIYFEKLDPDTNWFAVTRVGGVQTRTDTGVSINTVFTMFSISRTSAGVAFSINGVVVATHTGNIPTIFICPSVWIINSAAAAKTIDIDYFQLIVSGLVR